MCLAKEKYELTPSHPLPRYDSGHRVTFELAANIGCQGWIIPADALNIRFTFHFENSNTPRTFEICHWTKCNGNSLIGWQGDEKGFSGGRKA